MNKPTGPFDEMEMVGRLLTSDASARGYVTFDQILEILPQVENNLNLLEIILEGIQAAGVIVYDSDEEAKKAIASGQI